MSELYSFVSSSSELDFETLGVIEENFPDYQVVSLEDLQSSGIEKATSYSHNQRVYRVNKEDKLVAVSEKFNSSPIPQICVA